MKRGITPQKDVCNDSNTPHVHRQTVGVSSEDLWGDITGSSALSAKRFRHTLCEAKVGKPYVTIIFLISQ